MTSHLGVMVAVAAIMGVVVAGLAIPFAGVLGFAARTTAESMDELPQDLEIGQLPQRTTILDANGKPFATVFDQNRINVTLDQVSRQMVTAILAIEDYRYYEHGALDVKGTLRAFLTNAGAGGVVQGGSSITQQLVKLTLQAQAETDEERREVSADTYARKFNELRYAIALEKRYTKNQILEQYLNTAYFGDGAYGIQAAARHYFDVNARNLDLTQSAMLAGLVKSPDAYDPTNYPDEALARRNVVLDRMAELNAIPADRAEKAKKRPLGLDVQDVPNGCVNTAAPFFCSYVIEYLKSDPALGKTREDRERLVFSGGLTIRTSVDLDYQRAADASVTSKVLPTDQAIGALAIVEPGTGLVRAISQSRPMGNDAKAGETYLNYVVPSEYGDSNGFQAGSTFKAFTLAAAIQKGVPLNTVYNSPDATTFSYADYKNCPGAPSYGAGTFPMTNSTAGGLENLYSGTRDSVNTFYLRLEQDTGVCAPYKLAKAMGVRLTCPEADSCPGVEPERVPNLTLGVADVSPLEMAEAYATFAARGLHCDSRPVTSIEDSDGNVLKDYSPRCTQVMDQSTADAVNDILRGVIDFGFAVAQKLAVPAAGKTGTTQSGRSVWFVGYTPTVAAAAMLAGANQFGTPIPLSTVTVNGSFLGSVSGSGVAAPIWGDAMKVIDDGLPFEDFVYPSTVEGAGAINPPAPQPDRGGRGGRGGDGGRGGRGD
ncbi:transglycosylase domain-containing protein [Nocardioides sp.]|uniref:transglycosylase domain-containing protein n=1 Tax=Nocardioides sp. TaxID=35761 RepID=UPI0035157250